MPITFKYYFIYIRDLSIIGIWISFILREVYNEDKGKGIKNKRHLNKALHASHS